MISVSSRKRWTTSPSLPKPDLIAPKTAVAPCAHVSPQSPSPTMVSHRVSSGSSAITSSEATLIAFWMSEASLSSLGPSTGFFSWASSATSVNMSARLRLASAVGKG